MKGIEHNILRLVGGLNCANSWNKTPSCEHGKMKRKEERMNEAGERTWELYERKVGELQ